MKSKKLWYVLGLIFLTVTIYSLFLQYQFNKTFDEVERAVEKFEQIVNRAPDRVDAVQSPESSDQQDSAREQVQEAVDLQAAVPHEFLAGNQSIYRTPAERQELFDRLGLVYVNDTRVDYLPLLEMDVHQSEKYLDDAENNDLLTQLYGDDIARKNLMPMSIRWLGPQIGHGVFAEDDLLADGFIGIYGGVARDRSLVDSKDYAWAYPVPTLEGGKISLDAAQYGNELRFINDGRDPNCVVKYIIGHDGLWHVCYLAARDIAKGEQLLVSYGPAYWDTRTYSYWELASSLP